MIREIEGILMNEQFAFEKFIKGMLCSRDEYLLTRTYLKQASLEEKKLYLIVVNMLGQRYFEAIVNNKMARYNNFMRRKGMVEEDAFYCIQKYLNQVTDVAKILVYIEYKYQNIEAFLSNMFLRFQKCEWDKEKIQDLANNYFINYDMLLKLIDVYLSRYKIDYDLDMAEIKKIIKAREEYKKIVDGKKGELKQASWYYDNYASAEDKELGTMFLKKEKNKSASSKKVIKHQKVCLMLLNDIPFYDIYNYVLTNHVSMRFISEKYVDVFLQGLGFDDNTKKDYLKEKLLVKLEEFKIFSENYLKESFTFTEEDLLAAKAIVTSYVYGNMNYDTFQNSLGKKKLFYYISILEVSDKRLYNLYLAKNGQKKFTVTKEEIITFIENQDRDILNYYMRIGIPLENLENIERSLDFKNASLLDDFIIDNRAKTYSIKRIKALASDFGMQEIIYYLINNDIPVTDKTIEAVQNRNLQRLQAV